MDAGYGFRQFEGKWEPNAQMVLDTIALHPTKGIATWLLNTMQWSQVEEFSGNPPGSYPLEPTRVYLDLQKKSGVCFIDQWIPDNPLSMKDQGYDQDTERGATTGSEEIVLDGMVIDSPEAVVEHMEEFHFPIWQQLRDRWQEDSEGLAQKLVESQLDIQKLFGMNLLKVPYEGFYVFPTLSYGTYGYANYFMAYALYPEVIERSFKLQADAAFIYNQAAARAIVEGRLPKLVRLDHDMADSRGTLVDVRTLDRLWFPHFERAIRPFLDAGIRLIWHCDGNLSAMVPRLLEVGVGGFQGFQYEDGMDYPSICKMKTRDGGGLLIIGGVSVTRTLPHGTPSDVRDEIRWLVENGPETGLMLGCSSSIAPGVPSENIRAMIDGFAYYREHGRG